MTDGIKTVVSREVISDGVKDTVSDGVKLIVNDKEQKGGLVWSKGVFGC